jgi:hypothetical protein
MEHVSVLTGYKCETFNSGSNPLKVLNYLGKYDSSKIIRHHINGDPVSFLPNIGTKKSYNREEGLGHSLNNFFLKIDREDYA